MIKKIVSKLVKILLFPISFIVKKELDLYRERGEVDLKLALQRQANIESAQYILTNMQGVDSVDSSFQLLTKALNMANIEGLTLEFEVFKGQSINHIAGLTNGLVYGFDSFEGLPERWRDGFGTGAFKVNYLPNVKKNVRLIKGWFNESLPYFSNQFDSNIRFLHIDCDLYSSTKTIFELLGNKIIRGTVIVFDEYFNYSGWQCGEFKAFQEFINEKKLKYRYIGYNRKHEQVAVIIE